ncbi:MAG: GntR family transcriptional regulator [Bacteroidales bacterium]|jgi:predicted RNA-binding protein (virulence factor B family)|nr:GntR family transcriptional regulator [Bacteroidales bacterium]
MIQLGKTNKLKVLKVDGDLVTFDAEEFGKVTATNDDLLIRYKEGEVADVFLYPESDIVKASIGSPYAELGEFAKLRVVAKTKIGVFFDWGIAKDLFCPFMEQKTEPELNHYYLVYIYLDEATNRIAASTKIEKFFSDEIPELEEGQDVNILVINKSQIGYNVVVENKYHGLLYDNEVFTELKPGQKLQAVIKKIREDNKIDLRLYKNDHKDIQNFENMIIDYLRLHNGKMNLNDESDPEVIYKVFGISKKNFKKALGALYRKGIIDLKEKNVKLL